MDKLKTFLQTLSKKYKSRASQDSNDYYKVLGSGCFSIVFDIDGAAYKITTELNYDKQLQLIKEINMLYNLGVNVPFTYCIHSYNDRRLFFDEVKRSAHKNSYEKFVEELRYIISKWEDYDPLKNKSFCGIFQEKIEGDVPFNRTAFYIGEALMLNKDDVEDAMKDIHLVDPTTAEMVEKITCDLSEKLDYFLAIPDEHYVKFINDAFAIDTREIHIDNVTRKNYIYNKQKGFYFIDLGALNYKDIDLQEKLYWPMTCTTTNVLNQVVYPPQFYNLENKTKFIQLFNKLHNCIGKCYVQNVNDDRIIQDIRRYINKNRRSSDFYRLYKSFIYHIPKTQSDEYLKEYKYIESLVSGKALKSGEELENV